MSSEEWTSARRRNIAGVGTHLHMPSAMAMSSRKGYVSAVSNEDVSPRDIALLHSRSAMDGARIAHCVSRERC